MRMHSPQRYKIYLFSLARFFVILAVSLAVAALLNRESYKDYYNKSLFRLHTADLKTIASQMTVKLSVFLDQGDVAAVQNVLDASFGLFGYVITDCRTTRRLCPEQKILYSSSTSLPWLNPPDTASLSGSSFTALIRPPRPDGRQEPADRRVGEIIGRLYVIKNMPTGFADDYFHFIAAPFTDIGARRFYLRTTLAFVMGAFIIWGVAELYFYIRRKQQDILINRELELKQAVNRQMRLLTEKDAQITRLNEETNRHYEIYLEKIRELDRRVKNEEEYRDLAEQIIEQLEYDKTREANEHAENLNQVRQEMERLQNKITRFEESARTSREQSFKVLEEAVRTPNFSNVFEQQIFETISASPKYLHGEWRLLSNYDVAPGRNYRQFTDFVLFNRDAIIIIEAKYYVGLIDSPGDFQRDIWVSRGTQQRRIECLWGENPYHQLNEYSMSLMKILKQRSPWNFQVFGIIVFPDQADISKVGEHLGKFYRLTTLGKLLALSESIFAEASRFQTAKNPKRPAPEQVEAMLRGRKVI